jgi:hypothetical protein
VGAWDVECIRRVTALINVMTLESLTLIRIGPMPAKRERLTVRIFRIIEGEAESPFAISVFLIIVLAAIAVTAWRFQA